MAAFRLYGEDGCPYCQKAFQFLATNRVSVEGIAVGRDPVITEGIKRLTGEETKVSMPVLVSLSSNPVEVIVGFKEEDYQRVVGAYLDSVSPKPPNVVVTKGDDPQPAPEVAVQPE